ncbi:CLUMA_CG015284, isoform A [Clunio marinus]|uniref:CLUMA_CG015284, isoform A n=1 Tax=Clunio marinus TaxID=568069 RepID=A0A1J1IUT8_9DIPT|nr:CLUMA_CG015284, isoform A [Clunio marinus]
MEKWTGKIAVVTGASAGIGKAIVEYFAKSGIHVVGLARRSEKIEEIGKQLGETPGKIYAHKCDVSDLESVKETFKWIEEKFGFIHIHINNAAILFYGTILDKRENATEKINSVINTNFTGAVHCTREAVRLMEKSDDYGLLININSIVGDSIPFGHGVNVYAPTKYALKAFTEVLRQELILSGNTKIRVANLSPGVVETEMAVAAGFVEDAAAMYQALPHVKSEDVAEAVSFILRTPYNVNITQLTIKPVGEKV